MVSEDGGLATNQATWFLLSKDSIVGMPMISCPLGTMAWVLRSRVRRKSHQRSNPFGKHGSEVGEGSATTPPTIT